MINRLPPDGPYMKSMNKRITTYLTALLLWLAQPGFVLSQQEPQRIPSPSPQPPGAVVLQTPASDQAASDSAPQRPLYGIQGVLVETLDGRRVAAQNELEWFNPASAVKLATALVALRTFGPKHRFGTGVWTDGNYDKASGTVSGNIYISGRDPSLHYENAVEIARQLNALGVRTVTGNLVVSPNFTLNFNWSAARSAEHFYDTLDAQLRSSEATRAWVSARSAMGDKTVLPGPPSVAVLGDIFVGPVVPGARLLMTHNSSVLTDILKVLLCYSNNFMAERLGETLGGVSSVERQLIASLGLSEDQIRLASLSGLGVNRVTPSAMMKILRALRQEVQKSGLAFSDIMPVAGIDPGTLEDRFINPPWRGSVIAKTGTLIRTDGGTSSLVGQMRTAGGDILLFVIMNQKGNVSRFRENQDSFVMQVFSSWGGPKPFDYVPMVMAIKLSATKTSFGASEEYEDKSNGAHPR
jgi:D-alanyl-D-alanine carboxypeptidase/D-alanyl-D-alanine-endopeptidase (penicillin-binding protein 4)